MKNVVTCDKAISSIQHATWAQISDGDTLATLAFFFKSTGGTGTLVLWQFQYRSSPMLGLSNLFMSERKYEYGRGVLLHGPLYLNNQ